MEHLAYWAEAQHRMVELSTKGRLLVVEGSGHSIHAEKPALTEAGSREHQFACFHPGCGRRPVLNRPFEAGPRPSRIKGRPGWHRFSGYTNREPAEVAYSSMHSAASPDRGSLPRPDGGQVGSMTWVVRPCSISACTSAPGPTRPRPTARQSASFRPPGANRPTPKPTPPQIAEPKSCQSGSIDAIGIGITVSRQEPLHCDSCACGRVAAQPSTGGGMHPRGEWYLCRQYRQPAWHQRAHRRCPRALDLQQARRPQPDRTRQQAALDRERLSLRRAIRRCLHISC